MKCRESPTVRPFQNSHEMIILIETFASPREQVLYLFEPSRIARRCNGKHPHHSSLSLPWRLRDP